jgi:hypothetical protein
MTLLQPKLSTSWTQEEEKRSFRCLCTRMSAAENETCRWTKFFASFGMSSILICCTNGLLGLMPCCRNRLQNVCELILRNSGIPLQWLMQQRLRQCIRCGNIACSIVPPFTVAANCFYMHGTWHLPQDKTLIKSYRKDELCICFVHDKSKVNRDVTFVFATSPLRCITCKDTISELTVSILVPF